MRVRTVAVALAITASASIASADVKMVATMSGKMMGRTPPHMQTIHPIGRGVVSAPLAAGELLKELLPRALGWRGKLKPMIVAAVTALGFDGYMTALEALKAADSGERDDIADVVADVTYTGVTGAIAFDENGDALRDQAFIKAADPSTGTWTFVKVQGIEGN